MCEATTKPHVDELMLNMEVSVSEVIFPHRQKQQKLSSGTYGDEPTFVNCDDLRRRIVDIPYSKYASRSILHSEYKYRS